MTDIDKLVQDIINHARRFAPASPTLQAAIDRLDRAQAQPEKDRYDQAVREWVARQLRTCGHMYTRDDIRNVRFGIEEGWPGTDVTAGDADYASIRCQIQHPNGKWVDHDQEIEHIRTATLVQECVAIYNELANP